MYSEDLDKKRDLNNQVSSEGYFVPRAGFEPAQALAHCPLKTACLPVPPPRQQDYFSVVNSPDASTASAGDPSSAGTVASN